MRQKAAKTFYPSVSRHRMTSSVRVYYNNAQLSTNENPE